MAHNFDLFPVLPTTRLSLVEIGPNHAADLFRIFTNKRVTEHYTVVPLHEEKDILPVIERFKTQYSTRQGIRWGITLKEGAQLIGSIGFQYIIKGHKAGLVYALDPSHWGQGYMTEALEAVIKFGFEELNVQRLDAEVMPGNTASERILQRNGFIHEGLLRQWMQWDGKFYNMNMYSRVLVSG